MSRSLESGRAGKERLMTKFSQFVRSRLESGQLKSADHPDANLLLAFAERNLSRREHAAVLEHLANCFECREVVALTSATDGTEVAWEQRRAKRPAFRWGWRFAAAAGLACLAVSTVWWMPLFKSSAQLTPSPMIMNQVPPMSPPVSGINDSEAAKKQQYDLGQKDFAPKLETPDRAGRFSATSRAKPVNKPEKSDDKMYVTVPQTEAQVATGVRAMREVSPSRSTPLSEGTNAAPPVALRKNLVASDSAFSAAERAVPAEALIRAPRTNVKPVWTLDGAPRAGAIQKSDDGGKTWRTIRVDDVTRFYALSAKGSDVWVGGAGGKLFHSEDSGMHWAEIAISNEGVPVSGSITEIEASGEGVIKLKINSDQTWETDDGGVHWRQE
jgi:photosynthesis system II assembly factor YCF48-like protein/putative zinc finger protein